MSRGLETGDNPAVTKNLLMKVRMDLVKNHGHKAGKLWSDSQGEYASNMQDAYGNRYVLIAKGSKLYKPPEHPEGIVSCQYGLPNLAVSEKRAIILAWQNPDVKGGVLGLGILDTEPAPQYYFFDPEEIMKDNYGPNERFGVRMINFSIKLGMLYDPSMSIEQAWKKKKGLGAYL